MTNQRTWVLLVLSLTGVAVLPIITAEYDTSDQEHVLYKNDCLKLFEVMMRFATDSLPRHDPIEVSEVMSKVAYDYFLCTMESAFGSEAVDEVLDTNKSDESSSSEDDNRDGRSMRELLLEPIIPEALREIEDFHYQPNYLLLQKLMRNSVHNRLRNFVNNGDYAKHFQENHMILLKQMLYDLCDVMLSERLHVKAEIIIDRRLNPYISHKELFDVLRSQTGVNRPLPRLLVSDLIDTLEKLANSPEPYKFPDCRVAHLEHMIKCVLAQIAGSVMVETLLTDAQSYLGFWDPIGDKLINNLVTLLVEIIDQHKDEPSPMVQRIGVPAKSYIEDIYKARASIIFCLDAMRVEQDTANTRSVTDPSRDIDTNKCVKSASDQAVEIVYHVILHAGESDLEFDMIATLERGMVKELLREQMTYYAKLKPLTWFVHELIDNGILASNKDPEKSLAWEIVREWEESQIEDPFTRLATVIGNSPLVNITCPVLEPQLVSDTEIADDQCWRPVLEDLVIIESAVRKDEVSMEIVFYGHPIVMNYIYIVDRSLSSITNRRV